MEGVPDLDGCTSISRLVSEKVSFRWLDFVLETHSLLMLLLLRELDSLTSSAVGRLFLHIISSPSATYLLLVGSYVVIPVVGVDTRHIQSHHSINLSVCETSCSCISAVLFAFF